MLHLGISVHRIDQTNHAASICRLVVVLDPTGDDAMVDSALDGPDSTGLEQFTSGTLEACHPPWPCCWVGAMQRPRRLSRDIDDDDDDDDEWS